MNDKVVIDFNDSKFVQSLSSEITEMFVEDARRIIQLIDVEKQNKKNGFEFISIKNKYLSTAPKPLVINEFIDDARKIVTLLDTEYNENEFNSVAGKYVTPIAEGIKKMHEELADEV